MAPPAKRTPTGAAGVVPRRPRQEGPGPLVNVHGDGHRRRVCFSAGAGYADRLTPPRGPSGVPPPDFLPVFVLAVAPSTTTNRCGDAKYQSSFSAPVPDASGPAAVPVWRHPSCLNGGATRSGARGRIPAGRLFIKSRGLAAGSRWSRSAGGFRGQSMCGGRGIRTHEEFPLTGFQDRRPLPFYLRLCGYQQVRCRSMVASVCRRRSLWRRRRPHPRGSRGRWALRALAGARRFQRSNAARTRMADPAVMVDRCRLTVTCQ